MSTNTPSVRNLELTITGIPNLSSKTTLCEAMVDLGQQDAADRLKHLGQAPPTREALMRAAMSVVGLDGKAEISLTEVLSLLSYNSDPANDHDTPARAALFQPRPD